MTNKHKVMLLAAGLLSACLPREERAKNFIESKGYEVISIGGVNYQNESLKVVAISAEGDTVTGTVNTDGLKTILRMKPSRGK